MHTAALDGSVQGVVVQITNEIDLEELQVRIKALLRRTNRAHLN